MGLGDKIDKYYEKARQRAKRRKSPANLLLPLLHWPLTFALWILQLKYFYILGTGKDCGGKTLVLVCVPQGIAGIFFTLLPFMPAVCFSMVLTNTLLWMIPPVRRIFDREAAPYSETSYKRSQKALLKFSAVLLLVSWPLLWIAVKSF